MVNKSGLRFDELQSSEGIERLALTTRASTFIERFHNWVNTHSTVPFTFATACCSSEYYSIFDDQYPEDNFFPERVEAQNSDLLIISGSVNLKTYPLLKDIYKEMPKDKWVVVIGACPMSGGPFSSFNIVPDISKDIPVDIFIPGCPPSSKEIAHGMSLLKERMRKGVRANEH
ncbi:NADH-quinone oxidoreductase subunit B [Halobacteriovorax marinus]|uniref:NADH-quinone oxidoreductase subunit B n=1 Tax=Halobacteriovorax marinus TaxID=97084 RepID=UPI003A9334EA